MRFLLKFISGPASIMPVPVLAGQWSIQLYVIVACASWLCQPGLSVLPHAKAKRTWNISKKRETLIDRRLILHTVTVLIYYKIPFTFILVLLYSTLHLRIFLNNIILNFISQNITVLNIVIFLEGRFAYWIESTNIFDRYISSSQIKFIDPTCKFFLLNHRPSKLSHPNLIGSLFLPGTPTLRSPHFFDDLLVTIPLYQSL